MPKGYSSGATRALPKTPPKKPAPSAPTKEAEARPAARVHPVPISAPPPPPKRPGVAKPPVVSAIAKSTVSKKAQQLRTPTVAALPGKVQAVPTVKAKEKHSAPTSVPPPPPKKPAVATSTVDVIAAQKALGARLGQFSPILPKGKLQTSTVTTLPDEVFVEGQAVPTVKNFRKNTSVRMSFRRAELKEVDKHLGNFLEKKDTISLYLLDQAVSGAIEYYKDTLKVKPDDHRLRELVHLKNAVDRISNDFKKKIESKQGAQLKN